MAASALSFLTPRAVDALTPNGEIPDEASLLSKIKGFLTDFGGAIGAAVLGGLGAAGGLGGTGFGGAGGSVAKGTGVLDSVASGAEGKDSVTTGGVFDGGIFACTGGGVNTFTVFFFPNKHPEVTSDPASTASSAALVVRRRRRGLGSDMGVTPASQARETPTGTWSRGRSHS